MSRAGRPPSQPPPDLPGLVFLEPLGSGGYSDVHLYEQQSPRMRIAVKVLTGEITDDIRRQFTAEGDAMAALADHPYIVQVFRSDVSADGRPYLAMKYYPGPNLGARARNHRLPVADALRIGIQIASAVETAHRVGILHRDIKPANILIGPYGDPGLTDFGIAATAADVSGADGLSVPWSPPEVLYSTTRPDVRADVYSLAATVWHLLVGRSPFEVPGGDNRSVALMRRIIDAPPPATGRADVPEMLDRLLIQTMAKSPTARPVSAVAFARGLQRVEQEMRLPLTPIVVPTELEPERVEDPADATRVRAPSRVDAQGPMLPPVTGPGSGLGEQAPPDAPPPHRSRLGWAIAAIVVVLAAAVIVGVSLTRTGKGGDEADGTAGATISNNATDQTAVVPLGPPGTPTVTVQKVGAVARFSWTYDGALPSDTFSWRVEGTTTTGTATKPTVDRPATGSRLCLSVRVIRIDGSTGSEWSLPGCLAG